MKRQNSIQRDARPVPEAKKKLIATFEFQKLSYVKHLENE